MSKEKQLGPETHLYAPITHSPKTHLLKLLDSKDCVKQWV